MIIYQMTVHTILEIINPGDHLYGFQCFSRRNVILKAQALVEMFMLISLILLNELVVFVRF